MSAMSKKYKVTQRGDGYYSIQQVEASESVAITDSWDEALAAVRAAEKKRLKVSERRGCLGRLLGIFGR